MIPAILIALMLIFAPALPVQAIDLHYGAAAPEFSLPGINGEKIALSDFRGNIVVILYWKTDHQYSLGALQDCIVFSRTYKERGIRFIGLVADGEDMDTVRRVVKDNKIDFPILVDSDRQIFGKYGVRVYPTTVVIDKEGKFYRSIPAHAVTYAAKLEGYLRHMLGEISEKELTKVISLQREAKKSSETERSAERKYNLALNFARSGLIEQAVTAAESSLQADPDIAKTHVLLGLLYLEKEDAERAASEFSRALELEPQSHEAKTGQGMAYIAKGEMDRAIETLTAAASLNPSPEIAYYELGRAYELKGDKDKAIEMYKKALGKSFRKNIYNLIFH